MSYIPPHLREKASATDTGIKINVSRTPASASTAPRREIFTNGARQTFSGQSSTQGYGSYNGNNRQPQNPTYVRTGPPQQNSNYGGGGQNHYQQNGGGFNSGGFNSGGSYMGGGNRRMDNVQKKDPSDPFYSRDDVTARDKGLESRMYGTQMVFH